MLRIGLFTDGYLPEINGVSTAVSQLRRELERMGHETYVYAPRYERASDEEPRTFRFRAGPLLVYKPGRVAIPYSRDAAKSFAALDIVHSHTAFSLTVAAFNAAYRYKLPHIQTYHTHLSVLRRYIPHPIRPPARAVEGYAAAVCNRCSVITVPTRSIRDELMRLGVHRPIRILPFGPDMNVYSRPPVWKPRLELGIPDGAPLLLYAGRLAKEKNLVFLLAAFAEIRKNAKDAVMVWAGDGAMRGWLEEEGRRLGLEEAQRFTGFLDRARLTDLYKATDLLLFASKSETQGLVLVEAMAAGVPVIAVRAMGVRDVVENEVSGLLVPESVTEFARDATRVLADPALRACLSDEAKRAAEAMSIQRCAEHLVEIYEEARADLRHPARRLVSLGTRPKRCAEQGRARRGLPLRSEEQTADASSPSATGS